MDKNAAIRQRMKDCQSKSSSQSLVSSEKENLPKSNTSSNEASSPFVSCYASGVDESSFHTADGKSILSNLMSPHPGGNESQNQSYWAMVGQYSLAHSKENSNQQTMNDSLISMSPAEKSSHNWSWQSSLLPDTSISPIKSMTPQKAATPAVSEDPTRYLEEWEKEAASNHQPIMKAVSNSQDDSDLASETLNVSDVLSPVSGTTLHATKQYLEKIQKLERELRATKQKVDEEVHRRNKFDQGVRDLQEHCDLDSSQSLDNAASSTHQRLVDRNKTLAKEVRFADQTCVELSGKNSALEREISVLREQLDHLRSRNDVLQEKTAVSQAQSQQLQQKVTDLETVCSKNESEIAQLKNEKETVYEGLTKAKSEAVKWEFQCRLLQNQLNDHNKNVDVETKNEKQSDLELKLAETKEERNSLQTNVEQLEKYVSDLEGERNQLQREKLDLTTMKQVHCAEIQSLTNSLASTREELCIARNETTDARSQVERLSNELVTRETQHRKLLTEKSTELHELQMKTLSFNKSAEKLDGETRTYQNQLRVRNEEFSRLEAQITQVLENKRDVELALEESQCVVARLEKQLSVASDSLRQNELKMEKVMSLLAKADQNAVEARKTFIQGMKTFCERADTMEAKLGNQATQLRDRLGNLYGQLNFISSAIDFESELSIVSLLSREKEDAVDVEQFSRSLGLNATIDLEKMEEARTAPLDVRQAMNADMVESPCPSNGDRSDLSSIQDVSQFFPDGASKSPANDLQQAKSTLLSPLTPSMKETGSSGSACFHVRPFFDNGSSNELLALRSSLQQSLKARDAVVAKLKTAEEEKTALETMLQTRTRELNLELKHSTSLTRVVDELTRNQEVAQAYVKKINQEKLEVNQKLGQTENELHGAQERIAGLVSDVHNLLQRQGESSQYSAELHETLLLAEKETKKYEKQMSAYCAQTAQAVNAISELEERIQESEYAAKDIETYKTRLVVLDSQLRETEAQLRLSEEKCLALREEKQSYQSELDSMTQDNRCLVLERNHCLREISKLSEDLESATKKSRELSLKVEDCMSKLSNKDDELRKLHQDLTDIERLQGEKDALAGASSDLRQQLGEQTLRSGEVDKELEKVTKELQCTRNEVIERLDGLEIKLLECNERLASLTAAHTERQNEIERYRNLLDAADDLESAATARFLDAQSKLEHVQEERNSLQRECQVIAEKLGDVEKYYKEWETITSEKNAKQERDHAQQIKKLEEVLGASRAELGSRDARIKQLLQAVDELQSNASELSAKQLEVEYMSENFHTVTEQLAAVKTELDAVRSDAYSTSRQLEAMSEVKASLDLKIRRLRDHIREQGKKIIRWEEFHEKRGHFLEKIRDSNERTRQSAAKLAKLYSDPPQTGPQRSWTVERSDLKYLHEQLEQELFEISKELADVVPQFA